MKTIKYTTAALALLAAALFTTSANAANGTSTAGDLVFGMYDSSNSVTNSLEFDLGNLASLTNGETFNLGTDISTVFGASVGSNLVWTVAGSGGSLAAAGGLAKLELVISAPSTSTVSASPTGNSTPSGNIRGEVGAIPSNPLVAGTSNDSVVVPNGNTTSFKTEVNNNGNDGTFGLGSNVTGGLLTPYDSTTVANLYTATSGTPGVDTLLGTLKFNSSGTLTFNAAAVPEPSAYALGICAMLLFWVLKRRSSLN